MAAILLKRGLPLLFGAVLTAGMLHSFPEAVSAERVFEDCKEACGLYDLEGVIPDDEEDALNGEIIALSNELDIYVAVVIAGTETIRESASDSLIESMADDYYDELFNPQSGVDTDGILLLINNVTYYDYLSTSGTAQLYFTNSEANDRVYDLLGELSPDLKTGDYSGAVSLFCDLAKDCWEQGIPANYYVYDYDKGQYAYEAKGELCWSDSLPFGYVYSWTGNFLRWTFLGAIVAVICYFMIKRHYRFKTAPNPTSYVCQNKTEFRARTDAFLRQHTAKTRINTNNGGGGGGGGGGRSHSSSGGHSHGGGGRHR